MSGKGTAIRAAWAAALVALVLAAPGVRAADWLYTVRPGDNLWDLSKRYLVRVGYFERLRRLNRVEDPVHLRPGTVLRIPMRWLRVRPASATVVAIEGEAYAQGLGGGRRALGAGAPIAFGDVVHTGTQASLTVRFADGSTLLVQASTVIAFDTMSAYSTTGMVDTRLRLQGGRVESRVEPARGPGSRYEVITPPAVAAVRGTHFRVGLEATAETTRSEVLEGRVGVAGGRVERKVEAGFGTVTRAGEAPAPPRALLSAPALDALPEREQRLLLAFAWPAVAGARGYRAQLYPRGQPDRLLLDRRVERPAVEWNAPPDGRYLLRVRAIDAEGLEGLDADHEFTLDARPVAPTLLGPAPGARMYGRAPEFWWSVPEGVNGFHLQVAGEAGFDEPLIERSGLPDSRLRAPAEPPPGRYRWRVASIDAGGEQGPFSEPGEFRVLAVPAPPGSAPPEVDERQVRFAWGRAADASGYEFQLARDDAFADLALERRVEATSLVAAKPGPGTYYFRTRGVSAEGVRGAYGPVNRLEVPAPPAPRWLLMLAMPLLMLL